MTSGNEGKQERKDPYLPYSIRCVPFFSPRYVEGGNAAAACGKCQGEEPRDCSLLSDPKVDPWKVHQVQQQLLSVWALEGRG